MAYLYPPLSLQSRAVRGKLPRQPGDPRWLDLWNKLVRICSHSLPPETSLRVLPPPSLLSESGFLSESSRELASLCPATYAAYLACSFLVNSSLEQAGNNLAKLSHSEDSD